MPGSLTCSRCGSDRVVPDAFVDTPQDGRTTVKVLEHPEALIFRGARESRLSARVCCDCGLVELYAWDLRDL